MDLLFQKLRELYPNAPIRKQEKAIVFPTSFFLKGYDESIGLIFTEEENTIFLHDWHAVTDYWEVFACRPQNFRPEIEDVTKRYGLTYRDTCFYRPIADVTTVKDEIERFLEALQCLAYLDREALRFLF